MSYETTALGQPDLVNELDDVERSIQMAEADNLPFQASLEVEDADASMFDWNAMRNSVSKPQAFPDKLAQTVFGSQQPQTLRGFAQEFREGWGIGWQAKKVKTHTQHNDPVKQRAYALKRLMLQREIVLCSMQEQRPAIGTAAGEGPQTRGAFAAITPKGAAADVQTNPLYFPFPDALRPAAAAYYDDGIQGFDDEALETIVRALATAHKGQMNLMGLFGIDLAQRLADSVKKRDTESGPYSIVTRRPGQDFDVSLVVEVFKFHAGTLRSMVTYNHLWDLSLDEPDMTDYTARSGLIYPEGAFKLRRVAGLEHEFEKTSGAGDAGFYRMFEGLQCNVPMQCGAVYTDSDGEPEPPAEG